MRRGPALPCAPEGDTVAVIKEWLAVWRQRYTGRWTMWRQRYRLAGTDIRL